MQRIFGTILLSLFGVLFLAPDAFSAWKIDKFKTGKDSECFIDKQGNFAYWFCGDQKQSCNSLSWSAGQYRYTLKQGEVLSQDLLQAGEPLINDESLFGKYICCHKSYSMLTVDAKKGGKILQAQVPEIGKNIQKDYGVFRLNEVTTRNETDSNGKTCVQEYNACGNKVGECVALCGNDDEIEVNGNCHKKCLPGEVYESEDSFVCVSCPTGPRQKIVSADSSKGGYKYCLKCSDDKFIKDDKCLDKGTYFTPYKTEAIINCWKCAYSDTTLKECLVQSGDAQAKYIKENCKFRGY